MPAGSRVRSNNVFGLVTDNPLTVSTTSLNSNGLANLPSVALGTQHAVVTLDPLRVNGAPEIIVVSQHASLATVATIVRGVAGTTARSHPQGTLWTHTPMNEDYASVVTSTTRPADPYNGEIIYETDTSLFKYWNTLGWITLGGGGGGGGATLGYAENFGSGFVFTTLTDIPGGTVTINVPAGRRIKISGHAHLSSTVATDRLSLSIREGSTTLNGFYKNVVAANRGDDSIAEVIVSPSAGLHTYKLSVERDAGSGNGSVFSTAGTSITYLLVEDITDSQSPFAAQNVPMGELAYSQVTANQGAITTEVDLSGLSVNVVVPAGRLIKITGFVPAFSTTVSGDAGRISIKEGATLITLGQSFISGTAAGANSLMPQVVLSPSAGSHTYKLTGARVSGSGTFTMNADPTFPAFILVEDITPTPTPASTAPSSTLAYSEVTLDQGTFTAATDLTNLAVTIDIIAGRRIKITGRVNGSSSVANDVINLSIFEGATELQQSRVHVTVAGANATLEPEVIISPTTGTHTYKLTMSRFAGTGNITMSCGANRPAFILIEDVTGSGISGHTHSQLDDTGWITPTLLNGWVNYDVALYATAQYRKIGNTVHLKGLVKSGTMAADIFILPVGFRPTNNLHFATASNAAFGIVEIRNAVGTPGSVYANTGSNVWFSLETSFAVN